LFCCSLPPLTNRRVRTILSQNTTNTNSSRAYASLLDTFGPSPNDPKAVDIVKLHRSPLPEVAKSIQYVFLPLLSFSVLLLFGEAEQKLSFPLRCGGLANVKSKVIKNVLVEVRERNLSRVVEDPSSSSSSSAVKKEEDDEPKLSQEEEEEKLLSLDYVHDLSDELAMKELESFKGVGPKSESLLFSTRPVEQARELNFFPATAASCVLLFCLARDSFAVDTHVFRLSQQLGWVPAKATRLVQFSRFSLSSLIVISFSLADNRPTSTSMSEFPLS